MPAPQASKEPFSTMVSTLRGFTEPLPCILRSRTVWTPAAEHAAHGVLKAHSRLQYGFHRVFLGRKAIFFFPWKQGLWKCTRKPQQQLLSLFSCLINKNPLPLISWQDSHWLQLCRGSEARLVLLTPPTVFNSCLFYIVQLFGPHHLRQNLIQTHVDDARFNVKYSGVKGLRSDYSF